MPPVPERVRWAVDTLGVGAADRVLEIGCGPGVAAALVCDRLECGRMLAIDRSSTQIARASRRCQEHVAAGRLSLEAVELAELDTGGARFDKAFAVNVNVFWVGDASAELAAVTRVLAPGGALLLFYETPTPGRAQEASARLADVLSAGGFAARALASPRPTLVACAARPGG